MRSTHWARHVGGLEGVGPELAQVDDEAVAEIEEGHRAIDAGWVGGVGGDDLADDGVACGEQCAAI